MPVKPTYPGVYVQEVPSGVRTIVGVGTSIAAFIGRARLGPMNTPTLCLNFSDFERTFSSDYANSDLARAVRLFFQNGGTQCYVTRIAHAATFSTVTLKNEAVTPQPVLDVTAKSAGLVGDTIRLAVTYNGLQPESTFNLELFRWTKNQGGMMVKSDTEYWQALSMNPDSPRYALTYVNQNSKLITLAKNAVAPGLTDGYSQSGRPLPAANFTALKNALKVLLGAASPDSNIIRISVDGGAFVDIDFSSVDVAGALDQGALESLLKNRVNECLIGSSVAVTFADGPADRTPAATKLIRISSANGDVVVQPGSSKDLAVPLMLGSAQGGVEVSHYAALRPAPTGIVFKIGSLNDFATLTQVAFNTITVDGIPIGLGDALKTVKPIPIPSAKMYEDGYTSSPTGHNDGVREKMAIIAGAINAQRSADPTFKWSAEVWGCRLALIPSAGSDNGIGTIHTSTTDIAGSFITNVRYYSVGPLGAGAYQTPALTSAFDGTAPLLDDYRTAFGVMDKEVDLFNLMVLPSDADHDEATRKNLWGPASTFCQKRRAFLLMDPPDWKTVQAATNPSTGVNNLRVGLVKDYSAIFYPRVTIDENGLKQNVGPSGAIAGLMARIDASRGVWKAPAGTEADLRGVVGLEYRFSDDENGVLNPKAVNTLRIFPNGIVNWGARTMDGDDDFGSEYKYIPVRRLALFMEESLYRGLKWVVFEPNDEPLWAQIRLNVGSFMHDLFRQGAFQGMSPKDAYFVKCDKETTTQSDINLGMVNIWVGFAPLKPAEFVMLYLKQMAGQIQV